MKQHESEEHIEDELILEDTENVEAEERLEDKVKKTRDKLKTCEADKMQALEDLQRAKAEFLNSKKRLEEQKHTEVARTAEKFVASLLPLTDSFQMAMADTKAWAEIDEAWRKGVEGIKSQLDNILRQHNVTPIDALGAHFNHEEHEAVGTKDGESDMVLEVVQAGYKMNDTIIRPAKVIIGN